MRRRRRSYLPPAEILEVRQLMSARPIGDAVRANSREDGALRPSPETIGLSDGGFLTVYTDDVLDGSGSGIYVRRFNASGVPTGNATRVNNLLADSQMQPVVTSGANGRLTYGWLTQVSTGGFTSEYSLDARQFTSSGSAVAGSKRIAKGSVALPNTNGAYLYGYSENVLHAFSDSVGNTILICGTTYSEIYRVIKLSPEGTQLSAFTIDLLDGYRGATNNVQEWKVYNGFWGYASFDVSPDGQIVAGYELQRDRFVIDVGPKKDLKLVVRRYDATGLRKNDIAIASVNGGDPNSNRMSYLYQVQPVLNGSALSVLYVSGTESLVLRKFSVAGRILTSAIQVSEKVSGAYDLAVLPGGRHVIAYSSFVAFGADKTQVREFNSVGKPVGPAYDIAGDANAVEELQVDAISSTRAVVTWTTTKGPHDPRNIFVQRISLAPNVAPTLSGFTSPASYKAGDFVVPIAKTAVVTPAPETSLAGGKLRVSVTGTPHSSNRISFTTAAVNGIKFMWGNIATTNTLYWIDSEDNYTAIGTYATTAGIGLVPFELTFNDKMTSSLLQTFLRALRFRTINRQSTADRVISFSVKTSEGQSSNTASVTLDVI